MLHLNLIFFSYLQEIFKDVDAVLPTFHEPMHVGVCRENFSSKFRARAGTGRGEPCEQLWAALARLSYRLARMGVAKKHLWLETNVAQLNSQKDVRAPVCCRLSSYLFSIFESFLQSSAYVYNM